MRCHAESALKCHKEEIEPTRPLNLPSLPSLQRTALSCLPISWPL